MENPLDAFEFPAAPPQQQQPRKSPFNQSDSDYMSVSDSLATASGEATPAPTRPPLPPVDPDHPVDLAPRGSVDSGRVTILENTRRHEETEQASISDA